MTARENRSIYKGIFPVYIEAYVYGELSESLEIGTNQNYLLKSIFINSLLVEEIADFKYLKSTLFPNGQAKGEITIRIMIARNIFSQKLLTKP